MWRWLGRRGYRDVLQAQRDRRQAVISGDTEVIWLLEHAPVITMGRRPVAGLDAAARAGIEIVATERGGLATWHGPGQLVAYPIMRIADRGIGVKIFVRCLEQVCIDALRARGVLATRSGRGIGVWVGGAKIASVGIHVRRGVTMHGLALNLCNALDPYECFDPCGLGAPMTSAAECGHDVAPARLAAELGSRLLVAVDTLTRCDYPRGAEGT